MTLKNDYAFWYSMFGALVYRATISFTYDTVLRFDVILNVIDVFILSITEGRNLVVKNFMLVWRPLMQWLNFNFFFFAFILAVKT